MTNSAQQLMYMAAMLLEEQEDVAGAEEALRDAVALSETTGRPLEHIQASAFLGELLMQTGREDEALDLFEEVLTLARNYSGDQSEVQNEIDVATARIAAAQK